MNGVQIRACLFHTTILVLPWPDTGLSDLMGEAAMARKVQLIPTSEAVGLSRLLRLDKPKNRSWLI
jgi:hypothetical protein